MDPNSWLNASGERSHLLPRVEQSYIYEPQISEPSTTPPEAWIAGHLGQAGSSGVRISPPSDFSMAMLLAPREPAVEEQPISPASPADEYRPPSVTYRTHSSSTESQDSVDDDSLTDDEEYQRYEKMALEELERRRGGPLLSSNPRMRREVAGANTSTSSDDAANSTDADCSTPRPVSDADVTSSANVTSSADVNAAAAASHTGHADATSPASVSSSADVAADPPADTYRRRRDRNNHAAKMSRDKRRLRETTMRIREAFLKMKLREDMQLYEALRHRRSLEGMRLEL